MAPVQIVVDMSAMNAHIYNITIKLTDAAKNQRLSLPCWTPGSYLIREFAQHIINIKAYEGEEEVEVSKVNKNTFEINNTHAQVSINYEVYGFDSSIRASFIDDLQAFFNGSSLFLCPHNKEESEYVLVIKKPESIHCRNWYVATGMQAIDKDAQGFGSYKALSYEELIDYPVQISAMRKLLFNVLNTPHEIVLVGDIRDFDEQRLIHDLSAICERQINLFGGTAPFDRYVFIARFEEGGHGGLEHRNSSMLLASPYSLPVAGTVEPDSYYRNFLSLCSHEYFHAWNVKRLTPKSFVPFDLNKECYTTMLWQFEGITSYYDDYILCQAGLITAENYIEIVAKNYSRLLKNKGRFTQSLAQSSFDAWIKFYRPNENSQNVSISYYLKGTFVALLLDLQIRYYTKNKYSLDNLMKLAFDKYKHGIEEHEFLDLFKSFGVAHIYEFSEKYIYATEELPMAQWLDRFGLEILFTPDEQTIDDKTKLQAYWGLKIKFDDHHRAVISYVDKDGPAMKAALSPGDEIIAVNNIRLDPINLADLLGSIHTHEIARLIISRRKILRSYDISPEALPLSVCKIALKKELTQQEKAARISWLGQ